MLHVVYGHYFLVDHMVSPKNYMKSNYDIEKDFNDKISKYIIEKTNSCEILMPGVIRTRFGLTTLDKLCSGTKTLLMAYKNPDKVVPFYSAGDNMVWWALKICEEFNLDMTINLSRSVRTKWGNATFELDGKIYENEDFDRSILITRLDYEEKHPEIYGGDS